MHWRSKRQTVPAKSTAIAEYISLDKGTEELLWIRNMFIELGLNVNVKPRGNNEEFGTITIFEDNQPCIRIAENPPLSQQSKSIDLMYHIARFYMRE